MKTRLMIALGLVLFAVWLSAAIFTKKMGFAQSRAFLEDQARTNVTLLLEAIKEQPISPAQLSLDEKRVVLLWRDDVLKLGEVNDDVSKRLATYRGQMLDHIDRIGNDNWVIAARCLNQDCAVIGIRDTERKFAIRRLVASIFLPMFAMFMVGLGAVYLAIRYALRPLDALAKSVETMEPTRGLALTDVPKTVELLSVVDAINDMSRRTRAHLDREQMFLDACAHEIRTPIAGLIAQVQSLQDVPQGEISRPVKAHLTFIERSAQRASRIANQFLGLAKTRNRVADTTKDIQFDIVELVRTMAADAMSRCATLDICVEGAPQVWVCSDPLPIELILRNLIENAQQHAQRSDLRLKVSVTHPNDQDVVLRIEDNGQGVPASELALLGERFFRGSMSRSADRLGTGLGLSIVKDVAASLGGNVTFGMSRDLGGFSVCVTLGLRSVDKAA